MRGKTVRHPAVKSIITQSVNQSTSQSSFNYPFSPLHRPFPSCLLHPPTTALKTSTTSCCASASWATSGTRRTKSALGSLRRRLYKGERSVRLGALVSNLCLLLHPCLPIFPSVMWLFLFFCAIHRARHIFTSSWSLLAVFRTVDRNESRD